MSATTLPTSSGVPSRPIGVQPRSCQFRMSSCAWGGSVFNTLFSVQPGLIAFTVIPRLATVTVSKLNECDYCVAHHTPFLVVEGVSRAGVERVLDYRDHPEFDERDKLAVEYAIAAWERPSRIPDALWVTRDGGASWNAALSVPYVTINP